MFPDCRVGVSEDDALLGEVFLQRAVNHFAFKLRFDASQKLPFSLRDPQPVKGLLDFFRNLIPSFPLLLGRLQVIENILEVDAEFATPFGHRLAVEDL